MCLYPPGYPDNVQCLELFANGILLPTISMHAGNFKIPNTSTTAGSIEIHDDMHSLPHHHIVPYYLVSCPGDHFVYHLMVLSCWKKKHH